MKLTNRTVKNLKNKFNNNSKKKIGEKITFLLDKISKYNKNIITTNRGVITKIESNGVFVETEQSDKSIIFVNSNHIV